MIYSANAHIQSLRLVVTLYQKIMINMPRKASVQKPNPVRLVNRKKKRSVKRN